MGTNIMMGLISLLVPPPTLLTYIKCTCRASDRTRTLYFRRNYSRNMELLSTVYPMKLISGCKETLWNGDWIHLEVIIDSSTRSTATVDDPYRPYYTLVLSCSIVGVAVFAVIVFSSDWLLLIFFAAIMIHLIRHLVYLVFQLYNHFLQSKIFISERCYFWRSPVLIFFEITIFFTCPINDPHPGKVIQFSCS